MSTSRDDERFMAAALGLARRGLGRTWPNPAVACLIVRYDPGVPPRVVGRGWTRPGGRPHAETVALAQAGQAAEGATAYVTLEPCAHHGKTPPCAGEMAAAGLARVVSALEDPDERVSGAGHAMLRNAGIAVDVGCLSETAAAVNAGFLTRVLRRRPRIMLKIAVSRDHKLAARSGVATGITGDDARRHAHVLRATNDAIMVGSGTWRVDDPMLTCRLPGLENRSPVRIIVDSAAELPDTARLIEDVPRVPLWVLVSAAAPDSAVARLETVGARVVRCDQDGNGLIVLRDAIAKLGDLGITRLMVEGGSRLASALVGADLVDEIVLYTGTMTLGPEGVPALAEYDLDAVLATSFSLASRDRLGADDVAFYQRTG